MSKYVDGTYSSIKEAIIAINGLVTDGYSKEEMVLVGNTSTLKENHSEEVAVNIEDYESTSYKELLSDHKDKIDSGQLVLLYDEDSSLNDDLVAGDHTDEPNRSVKDNAPDPDLDSTASSTDDIGNSDSEHVSAEDDQDSSSDTVKIDDHDIGAGRPLQ
ncbi:hypothetical protein [Marinilactibacillus sp. Marseille-P9653]|uniref:hypothetical protein n=1 Tax=Marinilactibacillus sp. Marseille-P9653 TaxID=2866583 RepID=UPI001CE4022D|nr:hypothetical protein [Marinilactibacillus sp. Marseille-P9653]